MEPELSPLETKLDEESNDNASQVILTVDVVMKNNHLTRSQRLSIRKIVKQRAMEMQAHVGLIGADNALCTVRLQRQSSGQGAYFIPLNDEEI